MTLGSDPSIPQCYPSITQHPLITFYQATSYTSIYNKCRDLLSSCCCLNRARPSNPLHVFVSILAAISSVIITTLLLPVKLVLLSGFLCCKMRRTTIPDLETPSSKRPRPPFQDRQDSIFSHVIEEPVEPSLREYLSMYFSHLPINRIDVIAIARTTLEGIDFPEDTESILNLPAHLFFESPPNMEQALTLPLLSVEEEESETEDVSREEVPPSPLPESVMKDARIQFLQRRLPELPLEKYPEYFPFVRELLEDKSLHDLPLDAFISPTPPVPAETAPTSPTLEESGATSILKSIENEHPSIWQQAFTDRLLLEAPSNWEFVGKLNQYISLLIRDSRADDLKDAIQRIADPEEESPLQDPSVQQTARAYFSYLLTLFTQTSLPISLKIEMLNSICQQSAHWSSAPELLLPIIYDELLAISFLQREHAIASLEEEQAGSGSAIIRRLLPPIAPDITAREIPGYIALLQQKFSQPITTRPDSLPLAPSTNALLQALAQPHPEWARFKYGFIQLVEDICGRNNPTTQSMVFIINHLAAEREPLINYTAEAAASARATMHLLYQLLSRTNLSRNEKKLILKNITSYRDRCAPTWVTESNNQLELYLNSSTLGKDLLLTWVQAFKHLVIHDIYRNAPQWHIESAFKLIYQEPLGVDAGFVDSYTWQLAENREELAQQYDRFVAYYATCARHMVEFILEQAKHASQEQQNTLMEIILSDLEAVAPQEHVSELMQVFFPEELDYKPCKIAIIYLLVREGILELSEEQ
ncbi:hypothetical protein BOKEGFJH_00561 [Chlamydia avium]|nr:hypothetical protein BOKEGFJH_00561 [Chlamydia avium]